MTHEELRNLYTIAYKALTRERAMRERVLRPGPDRQRKIEEMDQALEAVTAMKDFCKLHTEEPPEQVMLFDELPAKKGGY